MSRAYLTYFARSWFDFRLKELRAAAEAEGVALRISPDEEQRLRERITLVEGDLSLRLKDGTVRLLSVP